MATKIQMIDGECYWVDQSVVEIMRNMQRSMTWQWVTLHPQKEKALINFANVMAMREFNDESTTKEN